MSARNGEFGSEGIAQIHGVSHVGIGVSDLDRAIAFYEGAVGFRLIDRYTQGVAADPSRSDRPATPGDEPGRREVALLRAGGDEGPVIVLSTPPEGRVKQAMEIDDVGTHHCAFWVTGIDECVRRMEAAGAQFLLPLRTFERTRGWGVPNGVAIRSCMVRDPDGTLLQLDERIPPAGRS